MNMRPREREREETWHWVVAEIGAIKRAIPRITENQEGTFISLPRFLNNKISRFPEGESKGMKEREIL